MIVYLFLHSEIFACSRIFSIFVKKSTRRLVGSWISTRAFPQKCKFHANVSKISARLCKSLRGFSRIFEVLARDRALGHRSSRTKIDPLLFITSITGLPASNPSSKTFRFAYDFMLITTSYHQLQSAATERDKWCKVNSIE